MTSHLKIPHDASVLVCDGRKALLLRNEGDEVYPNLQVREVVGVTENPRSREQGTDRPGRVLASASQRSAVEGTDFHHLAENAFAAEIAEHLEIVHRAASLKGLILVAPPKMLAALRAHLSKQLKALILAEADKDLVKLPVFEIERHLTAA